MELVFPALIALVLVFYARRMLKIRSLKQYRAAEVEELLRSRRGEIIVLDVRTPSEHKLGAIRGSLHIPLHELRSRLGELSRHKGEQIVCYCQTGSRSASAALLLKSNGFKVANLRGGIAEWNFLHR